MRWITALVLVALGVLLFIPQISAGVWVATYIIISLGWFTLAYLVIRREYHG